MTTKYTVVRMRVGTWVCLRRHAFVPPSPSLCARNGGKNLPSTHLPLIRESRTPYILMTLV